MENYFFLENIVTSHNVLYYQQLPFILVTKVRFYANNYFKSLPIVSTALKQLYEIGPSSPPFISNPIDDEDTMI